MVRKNRLKSVIITGCAGLLGSHTSRHLLKRGYRVIGIDNLSGGYEDFLPDDENFVFYKFNLESPTECVSKLDAIFEEEDPLVCYHFAAYAAEGLSAFIRHFNYTNNVLSSVNVINACIKHSCKIVFTSSLAVYGDGRTPFKENMIPNPIDPYGIAKYAVEMDLEQAWRQFGLRYTIIRPHNVVGIYQNIWDKYRNVVGIFIRRALDNEPMLVYGDGEQVRAFSDIQYYMQPFEELIDCCDREIFNLGSDQTHTLNELAGLVKRSAKRNGISAAIEHVEPRHEAKYAFCDHSKAKKSNLKFQDNTDLESLVNEMFAWAMAQPKREQKYMSYEIQKGIYEYWK